MTTTIALKFLSLCNKLEKLVQRILEDIFGIHYACQIKVFKIIFLARTDINSAVQYHHTILCNTSKYHRLCPHTYSITFHQMLTGYLIYEALLVHWCSLNH